MDKNIGKKLDGRYEITELIGEGGMADVYKAVDVVDNKTVAVKILKKEFAESEEFLRRFRNESKAIAVLSHPNIVKIYDVGFSEKIQFIVMEYIDGITLKEYMENNVIQIAPLAFMRGRTLNDAVIILDEAQNTTTHQIKMFLTRLGMNAKMIVTGDVTQIDLPPSTTSGLIQAMQILKGVNGIGKIEFTKKDIVRHKLVQRIVEAYDKFDDKRKKEIKEAKEKKTNIDNN